MYYERRTQELHNAAYKSCELELHITSCVLELRARLVYQKCGISMEPGTRAGYQSCVLELQARAAYWSCVLRLPRVAYYELNIGARLELRIGAACWSCILELCARTVYWSCELELHTRAPAEVRTIELHSSAAY